MLYVDLISKEFWNAYYSDIIVQSYKNIWPLDKDNLYKKIAEFVKWPNIFVTSEGK